MYMNFAEVKVYLNARSNHQAICGAKRGGGNPNKFIRADRKIGELINQLFPSEVAS